MKKRIGWFDGRQLENQEKILPLIYNLRFDHLLIKPEMISEIKAPHKMKLVVDTDKKPDLAKLPKETIIFSSQMDYLRKAGEKGYKTACYRKIEDQETMDSAWKDGSLVDYLVVEINGDTNIPLELLVAKLENKQTELLKIVNNVEDAEIAFGAIESGCDGAVLQSNDVQEIIKFDQSISKSELGKLELHKGEVVDVQHVGMGHRSCIDTTDLLKKNEGMIVGSTANGGLLVSSETHYLPYMELRPFRVNAGAVHSYVWAPNEMTAYMTELKSGAKVLCVDTEGKTREVTVGRVKTEIRPLLKIEVEVNGIRLNTIVQDDWHIRIFGSNGEPRNASTIKKGDEMLAYLSSGARHVGIKIDEQLQEK